MGIADCNNSLSLRSTIKQHQIAGNKIRAIWSSWMFCSSMFVCVWCLPQSCLLLHFTLIDYLHPYIRPHLHPHLHPYLRSYLWLCHLLRLLSAFSVCCCWEDEVPMRGSMTCGTGLHEVVTKCSQTSMSFGLFGGCCGDFCWYKSQFEPNHLWS